MDNPVTIEDYEARYGDVAADQEDMITEKLDDAWEVLLAIMPSVVDRYDSGKLTLRLLARVLTSAVHRGVINPKGYVSEAVGPFSYRLGSDGAGTSVFFTDAELALLGKRARTGNAYLTTRWPNWAGEC